MTRNSLASSLDDERPGRFVVPNWKYQTQLEAYFVSKPECYDMSALNSA